MESTVYNILHEAQSTAFSYICYIESDIRAKDGSDRSWWSAITNMQNEVPTIGSMIILWPLVVRLLNMVGIVVSFKRHFILYGAMPALDFALSPCPKTVHQEIVCDNRPTEVGGHSASNVSDPIHFNPEPADNTGILIPPQKWLSNTILR